MYANMGEIRRKYTLIGSEPNVMGLSSGWPIRKSDFGGWGERGNSYHSAPYAIISW